MRVDDILHRAKHLWLNGTKTRHRIKHEVSRAIRRRRQSTYRVRSRDDGRLWRLEITKVRDDLLHTRTKRCVGFALEPKGAFGES